MATGRVPTTANSPLTAKGDLFSFSTAPARLAVGSNGETLVADSSTTTGLRYQGSMAAGKNITINGNYDIWQRGTSFTTDAGGTVIYTADRWAARAQFPGNGAVQVLTQETSVVPVGSKFALKSVIGTANPANQGRMDIGYTMENQDALLLAGKTMTLSVKVRAIAGIDRFTLNATFNTAGGRSFDATSISSINTTITNASYTNVSLTFTVPSAATITTTGTLGFVLTYNRSSGSEAVGDGALISQVLLEQGSVPTTFTRAGGTIAGELAACQRYYYRQTADATAVFAHLGQARGDGATSAVGQTVLPVTMRRTPTSVDFSTVAATDGSGVFPATVVALAGNQNDAKFAAYTMTFASGVTQFRYYYVVSNNNATGHLGFSAEL